jgi:hypothetical protein
MEGGREEGGRNGGKEESRKKGKWERRKRGKEDGEKEERKIINITPDPHAPPCTNRTTCEAIGAQEEGSRGNRVAGKGVRTALLLTGSRAPEEKVPRSGEKISKQHPLSP